MSETTPGASPAPQQPNLPGGPKKDDRPDFRVIRSAPPPDSGPNLMPLVLLVVVVALGVGGYMFSQKGPSDGGDGSVSTSMHVGVGYGSYYGPGWYGGYYEPYPPVVVVPPGDRPDRPNNGERPSTLPSGAGGASPQPAGMASSNRATTAPFG